LAKLLVPEEFAKSPRIPLKLLFKTLYAAMDLTDNPLLSLSTLANAHPTDVGVLGSLVMHSSLETVNKLESMIPTFCLKCMW
jgi:hypothetical protein